MRIQHCFLQAKNAENCNKKYIGLQLDFYYYLDSEFFTEESTFLDR
jgi:hypothetical protein